MIVDCCCLCLLGYGSLFVVCCLLFVGCCVLVGVVSCVLFVCGCLVFVGVLGVVRRVLLDIGCYACVVCVALDVVRCW